MQKLDYAIDIVGLSKRFKRQTLRAGYTTLKSSILSSFLSPFRRLANSGATDDSANYTQAIKDLTLRVPQGASVGIIGQNGSGKSTLLKLITGIYKPSAGRVAVNGRVAALIELGAGFHPDFTGRENLYLGGVMHGLTRAEIGERFAEIVHFAELEDVIDDPVRTYSSGMFMRLGFSLAVHTEPDVLIVDEVLAVGDAAFVSKCKEKITALRRTGKTLLLVSHDLSAVERWCDEAVWLHKGEVRDRGYPRRVIDHYREFVEKGEEAELKEVQAHADSHAGKSIGGVKSSKDVTPEARADLSPDAGTKFARWGSREIEILNIQMHSVEPKEKLLFHPDEKLVVEVQYRCGDKALARSSDVVFGVAIRRTDGVLVHGSNTEIEGIKFPAPGSSGVLRYEIERLSLLEGNYLLDVAVHRPDGYAYDYHQGALEFAVRSPSKQVGVFALQHSWALEVSKEAAQQ